MVGFAESNWNPLPKSQPFKISTSFIRSNSFKPRLWKGHINTLIPRRTKFDRIHRIVPHCPTQETETRLNPPKWGIGTSSRAAKRNKRDKQIV
jgi:hypothetical protein